MAAHQRSAFPPLRLQQILSGGRAMPPSLKLESEPPQNVKEFIDRVIKCPLHDIAIPLSGFRWEYNKGNFHHWRPLFLHFDTYFKTYIASRKDLLLSDEISDEEKFPRSSVLQILRVMQVILENCHNKSSFNGLEHFKLLLASTDPEILIATLETLCALVKINPSKLHGSGKLIGCGSLNNYLLSLAQGWGSKEEGLGLSSCVVATEEAQDDGMCLFPAEENTCEGAQNRLGSTLHFEFHVPGSRGSAGTSDRGQASNVCVIHVPDLHLYKEDDLVILKQFVQQYNVPPEHRFSLLTRIRYAHAFHSRRMCKLYSRICIFAFIVLVQSSDAHDELVSFFANEPGYTNELISLVRSEGSVPGTVRALSMLALGAQLAAYTSSHERARILSGSSIISAGGNRMMLLSELQKAVVSLNNLSDPSHLLFVNALLQFFLLHVLSSSSTGSSIRGLGMVPPLLPLLQDSDSSHMHLVYSAIKILQKLMEYSNPAVSLFKDLGGVELLSQRLQVEVHRVIGADDGSSSGMITSDSLKIEDSNIYYQKRLIKVLLKALVSATYSPANSTRSHNSYDNSLPAALSLIFRNVNKFGGDIFFSAVTLMSEIIHKDPTCFPILHELGLPDAFLSSVISGILPSSKALICIPSGLGAICLNTKGLEAVKETAALRFLVDTFTMKKYLVAMNEGVVLLANAMEELLRHVSSLRSTGVDIIIEIVEKLAFLGDHKCLGPYGKVDENTAMETDGEDKVPEGHDLVSSMDLNADGIDDEQFVQMCIFHVMVLVHRVTENSETCRLFVEKKGIEALMKLLLRPNIAQSSEGMPIALHSTVVFKGFTQHHSSPLAHAFCSSLREHLARALSGLSSVSGSFLLSPLAAPDSSVISPLFVVEFLLFLAASKDNRWISALLTEFGNGSKDVLEDIGRLHREVLWQIALLEDSKLCTEVESSASTSEAQSSSAIVDETEEHRFNSFRQYADPLLRRRGSGWSIESQFFDLISMYRDISHASRVPRRLDIDGSSLRLLSGTHSHTSSPPDDNAVSTTEGEKPKSYYSCREMMKSLAYHIGHLFLELGNAMLHSSRRGNDPVNVSASAKSVASMFASIILDHLNFGGHLSLPSKTDVSISTKCRYLGKVIDFIDGIILDKPESCNPIMMNCFYGRGVVQAILTTFEATSQLLFAVNRAPASPMETDYENIRQDENEDTDRSWIYGPLASYGTLMDHLVTSSFVISSTTKQLLEQPLANGSVPFPRDAETFVKVLQSKVLKAVLPIWTHPQFSDCDSEFITTIISIMRHVYSGVEVRNVNSIAGSRMAGHPPDEPTILLIVEMGFSRSRAEEALRQVGTNSVELATDWLFSNPEEPQEDDELARALAMSLGNTVSSLKEDTAGDASNVDQEEELVQPPSVDDLLSACIRLLQVKESLAFPVRDLIVMFCSQNNGENRTKVLTSIVDHLRRSCSISDPSSSAKLAALFHVVALILHEDAAARVVASGNGLAKIILDLLSQWVPVSHAVENSHVPKWVTTSFLAIDRMLQIDPKLAMETRIPDQPKKEAALVINESKQADLESSMSLTTSSLDANDQKRLIEIACKCIQNKLPSEIMHVVLQLCATLTKVHSVAVTFLDAGGLLALLSLPTSSLFPGFDNVASSIIRHILEDPQTLQQAMESEIRRSLVAATSRHSNGRVTTRSFVQSLASVISRDPVVFMQAAKSICQIEMAGDRSYVVLKKDREKEKSKEKEKTIDKDKQHAVDGKGSAGDTNTLAPVSVHGKLPESNIRTVKVHRKSPQSFTTVIDFLLDSIVNFFPSTKVDDLIHGIPGTPLADMDIDSTSAKGKGKAIAVPSEGGHVENQEALASLAKTVFILKLLTELLLTYPSSIHVLLRRDAEVSSLHSPQQGSLVSCGGIFHHALHKFLPHSGMQKKDKKAEGDWRHKLVTRANQFLVASSVRSLEGRRRIFTEINHVFNDFVDSSDGCRAPNTDIHSFTDLLNDILAARLPTGSPISAEASMSFIDVGLVKSLTRTLQVLDLDNPDSTKVVTGIIKALELVTKEHIHSTDLNALKGDASLKSALDETQHEQADDNGNAFQALETMSQPDNTEAAVEQIENFNTVQTSGSADFITDDTDHDRDLDGGFAPEGEDDFMHENSEEGGGQENGVSTVEIRFEIPQNMEANMGDEDDDEDMSGGEGDEGEEEEDDDNEDDDDDEDDEDENNYLEEGAVHHMSHQDTDQEDHEMDDEFDEDVLDDEDEDDEDDGDGVILRLEEGINGINVLDHIEVFGGGNNFSNETLRVMPLEVFGSRRPGRSTSIINLLGRSGDHVVSAEHPFLIDPSSRHVVHQRQSEGAVDMAFSDRNMESTSSRLDAIFRSLSPGRHGRRFSMWMDDSQQQRGASNAPSVPQGIEELLVSQLRRPTSDQPSGQNAVTNHQEVKEEGSHLQQSEAVVREEAPMESTQNDAVHIPSESSAMDSFATVDVGLGDGGSLHEVDASNASDQVIEMQYERNEAAVRDVEAVSQGSSGSGATVGESLRSLEVEIGSADGHDDGGERQGDLQPTTRFRRPSGSTVQMVTRDASLQSVSEVPSHPPEGQTSPLGEQQINRETSSGAIDPTFLEALPEELRAEVLSAQQNQPNQPSGNQPQPTGDIDPEFLAALPPDIRAEVLAQQQAQRLHQSQELEGQPVEMDTVSIIATFPSDLREEVLLTSPDAVLANLTPALVAEANMLRERFARRYRSGALFGMYPRNWRGESSRRGEGGLDRDVGATASRGARGTKFVEADGAPLVDTEALKAMIRLLRIVQPLYKGQLQRLLLNLCAHQETRSSLVQLLMELLMVDVRGPVKSLSGSAESSHRLYACQSYVTYSRPQSPDGVPPLVSRRILETLTYLARNHPQVAKLFLHLELPHPLVESSDQGHGKAVLVMEEDQPEVEKGDFFIILLLNLLNQPLYLRSVAHLEQLLNLLEVVVDNAEITENGEPPEKTSSPESAMQDVSGNADIAGSSSSGDATLAKTDARASLVSGTVRNTHAVLLSLPRPELQLLCSLLAREGLSDSAYLLVAEILKKIVAIAPAHCQLFISELADSVQRLIVSALSELRQYEEVEKAILSSFSTDGNAILRVLQALSSLVASLSGKGKEPQVPLGKDHSEALSQVWGINAALEPLWQQLSNCISKIESSSESALDLSTTPNGNVFTNTSAMPPLPAGTQNILPYIESFFVTCEKLHPGQSGAVHDSGSSVSDFEDVSTSTSGLKSSMTHAKLEERNTIFIKFSEKHRKLLNAFIRQNPGLLEKSFSLMLKVPRFIDFDNKRAHFRSKIKHQHDHHHGPLRISVRRAYILEDSYNQLRMRSPQDLKGRLTVHFQGEEGIDAGGLTREWYQLLSRVIFDKGALLFTTVGNESTFQPNPNSVIQPEHLSYFKFVGRVVGKALFDGQLLDVHFTRSFYKHILGVKVTYHDIEAVDPDYFKNLKWMLENDISDVLDLTFSMDADEEALILYERAEVTDYELIKDGRNTRVTEENKHEYVDLVAERRLTTAIRPQINAFMEGFNDLIPKDLISIFNDKELELLISGLPDIDLDDLRANTEYSGYNNVSPVIQWFWEVVQSFSKEDKARLLQFVTGTSKVPLEGFSALQGISGPQRFQIHKAYGSANHLPSAHTCFNQLDLPEYSSKEQLQERLLLAIHEANEGFGFG
uniref:HECT-type E3 ubiquitin transferase n=1 Tax=Anthurium amnicola TaxID=1678845 RepID=A0A1D1YWP9_9ARAE